MRPSRPVVLVALATAFSLLGDQTLYSVLPTRLIFVIGGGLYGIAALVSWTVYGFVKRSRCSLLIRAF